MSYLIDTNIISEVRKGARCDAHVSAWYASIADEDLFLSTLVLGEIRKGVELARPRDAAKAAALEGWLREVEAAFDGRVLGIDNAVSDQWGRMSAIRSIPAIVGLLAATALTNGLTLVTCNDRDVAGLLNPFKAAENRRYGASWRRIGGGGRTGLHPQFPDNRDREICRIRPQAAILASDQYENSTTCS